MMHARNAQARVAVHVQVAPRLQLFSPTRTVRVGHDFRHFHVVAVAGGAGGGDRQHVRRRHVRRRVNGRRHSYSGSSSNAFVAHGHGHMHMCRRERRQSA